MKKHWFANLFMMLLPAIVTVLYSTMSTTQSSQGATPISIEKLDRCVPLDPYGSEYTPEHDREKCLTLLYGPKSEKFDAIMNILAELNGLTMGEDIIGVNNETEYVARIYPPYDSDVPFVTGGVYFVDGNGPLEYHIWSNITYQSYYFGTDPSNLRPNQQYLYSKIQLAVENAINKYYDPTIPAIELSLQDNPALNPSSMGALTSLLQLDLCIGFVFLFFHSTYALKEKRNKQLDYLRGIGIYESVFFHSQTAYFYVLSLVASILYTIAGRFCDFEYFTNPPFIISTLVYMFYFVGMSYAGLYISTFVIRQWVYVVFLVLFFFLSLWLCNITRPFDFLNILFFFILADPFSFLTFYYNNMPAKWSAAESSDMLTYIGVLAIMILCCYCLLFFYFWYSSYRNGFKMSCCFYASMDFWKSIHKPKENGAGQPRYDSEKDEKNSRDHNSIIFSYTTKTFPNCTAVSELHMEITPNQIFTLLGPNGCGKTTSISMLTGVYPPTYGEIYLCGQNLQKNREMIRDRFGVCRQDDHFWDGFTPADMFSVIGRILGLSNEDIESEKKRLLQLFKLSSVENKPISMFSGGMKRKMTIALACIKGFDILILDEPTSGMDPISRSELWNVLTDLKKDHTILLTTHSMEEADVLSDTVGIMFMGRLRAIGTPNGMKKHYGKGYKIDILLNEGTNANEIFHYMRSYLVNSNVVSYTLTKLSIGIDKDDLKFMPRFLKDINTCACTKEWLISPSSMDEVFIKVVESNTQVENADSINLLEEQREKRVQVKLCEICHMNPAERVTVYTKKGRAIVVDNLYCKKCFSDSDSESETEDKSAPPSESNTTSNSPYPEPSDAALPNQPGEQSSSSAATDIQLSVMSDGSKSDVRKLLLPEVPIKKKPSQYKLDVMLDRPTSFIEFIFSLNWLHFTLMKKDGTRLAIPIVGMIVWLGIVAIYSSILGMFALPQCDDGSFAYAYLCVNNSNPPHWSADSDGSFINHEGYFSFEGDPYYAFHNFSLLVDDSKSSLKADSLSWVYNVRDFELKDRFLIQKSNNIQKEVVQRQEHIRELAKNSSFHNYYLMGNTTYDEAYNFLIETIPQFTLELSDSDIKYKGVLGMYPYESVYTSVVFGEEWQGKGHVYSMNGKSHYINPMITILSLSHLHTKANKSIAYYPLRTSLQNKLWAVPLNSLIQDTIKVFIPAFFIVLSLFVVYRIVKDRANNCLSILYINGVRSYHYVTSLLIFYTLFLLIFMIIYILFFVSFKKYSLRITGTAIWYLLWSCIHCSSFFIFVSCCFKSPSLATIVNIFINAIGALLFNSDVNTSLIFAMLPGSFMMIVTQYIAYPSLKRRMLCNEAFIYSLISTILFIILSYVVMWLSQDLSITLDRYYQKKRGASVKKEADSKTEINDESVKQEQELTDSLINVQTPDDRRNLSLIVSRVSKYFFGKTGKRVFPEISFAIRDNDVFGLLGPNGAGKTTLINVMTGNLNPNMGQMKIFGYDGSNVRRLRELIAVVPQFDTFFDDMTVEEHLALVARLHHTSRHLIEGLCKEKAEIVGLSHDAFKRKASVMSGGQKRRLTLGMALMSQPRLLFLDEPTTGLDPETRFAIWDVVKRIQKEMSILITTHSMEEADALCTRIAIMTSQGLQCIGDQVELKNKFGKGFLLSLSLAPEITNVVEYVKFKICSDVEFLETKANIYSFTIMKDRVDLSKLLITIMDMQRSNIITYWSINESSLSDVFEKICKSEEQ